jgi:hypothetical protein
MVAASKLVVAVEMRFFYVGTWTYFLGENRLSRW